MSMPIKVSAESDAPSPFANLFKEYSKRHPSPLSTLPIKVETASSVSAIKYEDGVEMLEYVFHIYPEKGKTLSYSAKEADGWPLFAPIIEPFGLWFIEKTTSGSITRTKS